MARFVKRKPKVRKERDIRHADLSVKPQIHDEEGLLTLVAATKNPLILILDEVQDPHNLGACMRSADGAGVTAVVVPKHNAVTLTEAARRVACGGGESIPFVRVTNVVQLMERLKEVGVWIVGTSDKTETLLYDIDLTGPMALVMGAEGSGCRRLTMEHCDFLAKLPMKGIVPCLNVSVATGVSLYEIARQRLMKERG
jgi:23S rRNA (guanosine2251-2'-O)-methyltransferase